MLLDVDDELAPARDLARERERGLDRLAADRGRPLRELRLRPVRRRMRRRASRGVAPRAIAMRCFSPPESDATRVVRIFGGRRSRSSHAAMAASVTP